MDNLDKIVEPQGGYGKIPSDKLSYLRRRMSEISTEERKEGINENKRHVSNLIKCLLKEFGYYVGNSEASEILREIADEYDD